MRIDEQLVETWAIPHTSLELSKVKCRQAQYIDRSAQLQRSFDKTLALRWSGQYGEVDIAHGSWQHVKMKFLWRYGKELCYTLESIQTLPVQNDNENGVDSYNSKMCLGFMSLRAPPAVLKQKNYRNSPNMQPIITYFQGWFKFTKRHILVTFSK